VAWYQRTYFNLRKFCIKHLSLNLLQFVLILFFIIYCNQSTAQCLAINKSSFLNPHLIGKNFVYTYGNVNYMTACDVVHNLLYNSNNNNIYKIVKFNDVFNTKFPYNHPFFHPHLNISGFNNVPSNIYINIQMSTNNFNDCFYLSEKNILGEDHQWIAKNFYLYSSEDVLKFDFYKIKSDLFIENNFKVINDHVDLVLKSHIY